MEAANALPFSHDFTSHHRVMDLGGGTGSFVTSVLTDPSHLEGVLFERPEVASVAWRRIPQSIADRIRVVEGDFFTDPIPQDSDVIIISNVLHLLLPDRNLALLRRLRQMCEMMQRCYSSTFGLIPHTEPMFAALMTGALLLRTGEGHIYSEEEVRKWLQTTGWRQVDRRPLGNRASVIVAATAS